MFNCGTPARNLCVTSRVLSESENKRFKRTHIPLQITSEATLWMMDCSEEVQPVSEEPSAQIELKKGMSIFIDVSIKCFFYPY